MEVENWVDVLKLLYYVSAVQLRSLSCFFFFYSLEERELGAVMQDHWEVVKRI